MSEQCSHGILFTEPCEQCDRIWETEVTDKLFLELSQFSKAKTGRELKLESINEALRSQVAELQALTGDSVEYYCEKCNCLHLPTPGKILQLCPECDSMMTPTSYNLRKIAELQRYSEMWEQEVAVVKRQLSAEQEAHAATIQREAKQTMQLDEAAKQEPVAWAAFRREFADEEDYAYLFQNYPGTDLEPLYRLPPNLPALIEQAKAEEADRIGKLIHWPECWDTAAYPTLEDALTEINHCTVCENPEAHGYPKDWPQQRDAIRARKP